MFECSIYSWNVRDVASHQLCHAVQEAEIFEWPMFKVGVRTEKMAIRMNIVHMYVCNDFVSIC